MGKFDIVLSRCQIRRSLGGTIHFTHAHACRSTFTYAHLLRSIFSNSFMTRICCVCSPPHWPFSPIFSHILPAWPGCFTNIPHASGTWPEHFSFVDSWGSLVHHTVPLSRNITNYSTVSWGNTQCQSLNYRLHSCSFWFMTCCDHTCLNLRSFEGKSETLETWAMGVLAVDSCGAK